MACRVQDKTINDVLELLIALGVDTAGKRQILGCSVSLSWKYRMNGKPEEFI